MKTPGGQEPWDTSALGADIVMPASSCEDGVAIRSHHEASLRQLKVTKLRGGLCHVKDCARNGTAGVLAIDWIYFSPPIMEFSSLRKSKRLPGQMLKGIAVSRRKKYHARLLPSLFRFAAGLLVLSAIVFGEGTQTSRTSASTPPTQDYLVYVVCEAADKIVLIRFGPGGAHIESDTRTGLVPTEINGPHGIAVSPDKKYLYVSEGHGRPDGSVWKYTAGSNHVIKYTSLGLFPATTDITPDGNFIYVANANFHGDMVPSSISVVATDQLIEVKRITTCTMPHGSRLNHAGTKHYSVCMMDDMLVEIDTSKFAVDRYFMLAQGKEMGMTGAPYPQFSSMGDHKAMDHKPVCTPTWAQPSNDGSMVYVACNQSNEIVAIDTETWTMARRFPAGNGVYNLAMTKDGRLIATNKRGQSVSVFDPVVGKELARIPTQRKVVHGAVVTPDDRYAFITVEGVGTEPGTVEVIDLGSYKTVATVDVGPQAAGIDFWKTEASKQ
jgi:DNA-binding beta-propeller fold protein YncE